MILTCIFPSSRVLTLSPQEQIILESQQIQMKVKKWLILLNELRQDNIDLKNKLSETLQKRDANRSFVENADRYQQNILIKDQVFDLFRHDLTVLIAKLKTLSKIEKETLVLERDINKITEDFFKMKAALEDYLTTKQD